jgi:competence protein ComEC
VRDIRRRRPALLPTASLLAGIALAWRWPPVGGGAGWAAVALLALAAAARPLRPRIAAVCLCLCLVLTGLWLAAQQDENRRVAEAILFPAGADVVELHFIGTVLEPPERDWSGDVWLRLRGLPESAPDSAVGSVVVLLRVLAGTGGSPQQADAVGTGERVRVWCRLFRGGRPRGVRERSAAAPRRPGLEAVGRVKSQRLIERLEPSAPRPRIDRLKQAARRRLDRAVGDSGRPRALLGAMLLGDREGLAPDLRRTLRDAGMLHLVAISGLHVGILVGLLLAALRRTPLAPWWRFMLTALLLAGFVPGVGARPSVVRAAAGAAVLLFGRCLGREGDGVNGLLLLAAALVMHETALLAHPGFQLTFLATIGIVVLHEPLTRQLPLPPVLRTTVGVSTAAYLATAPAVAYHFRWLSPVALASNLLAVPLCAFALGSGYAALVVSDVPLLGAALGGLADITARGLLEVAAWAAAWESGAFCVVRPSGWVAVVYYGLLVLGGRASAGPVVRPLRRGALLLVVLWLHAGAAPPPGKGRAEVDLLDVGQGLSVAVRGPRGRLVLVDAGGSFETRFDPGERIVLPHLVERGGRRLDALVLTHDHLDHVGGARALLREIEVGELWVGPGAHRSERMAALVRLAHDRGTAVVLAEAGTRGLVGAVRLRVLAPTRDSGRAADNDASVVVLLGEPPGRLLVTGDIEDEGERVLLASGAPLRAEALVVAHHGSRDGTSDPFLRQVRPRWALISVGRRNPFGHPHDELLERLARRGVRVLRTDQLGSVRMRAERDGWRTLVPLNRRRAGPE